jgi:hypothetical protein
MYGEHLVDLGRRSAYDRLAHLVLELLLQLRAAGLADELSYTLPLTQELMADVLGLSGPHINRMVRCLRDEDLATIAGQRVIIHDLASLSTLAGFEEHYHNRRPTGETGKNFHAVTRLARNSSSQPAAFRLPRNDCLPAGRFSRLRAMRLMVVKVAGA